ncbi:MAG: STAS domain-containing protein [Nitrospiraceae bacterium]|nr:STAS domain-containing protein [Nitrospiraceae bacterium]
MLKPTGELTIFEVGSLCDALKTAVAEEAPVTLDLSRVTKLDASAVQLLIAAHLSGRVAVSGLSDECSQRVASYGFTKALCPSAGNR